MFPSSVVSHWLGSKPRPLQTQHLSAWGPLSQASRFLLFLVCSLTPLSTPDRCSRRCSLQREVRVASLSQTLGSYWPFLKLLAHSGLWLIAFHSCLSFWPVLSPVVLFRGGSVHQGGLRVHRAPRPEVSQWSILAFSESLWAPGDAMEVIPLPLSRGFLLELSHLVLLA